MQPSQSFCHLQTGTTNSKALSAQDRSSLCHFWMDTLPFACIRRHWLPSLRITSILWRSLSSVSTIDKYFIFLWWSCSFRFYFYLLADLKFIWSVREVKVARQLLPEINEIYELLVNQWGEDYAQKVLDINIYITDKNKSETASFRAQIRDMALFKSRKVVFIRPKLAPIIEEYVVKLSKYAQICGFLASTNRCLTSSLFCISSSTFDLLVSVERQPAYSSTLLAFCGGPAVSAIIAEARSTMELRKLSWFPFPCHFIANQVGSNHYLFGSSILQSLPLPVILHIGLTLWVKVTEERRRWKWPTTSCHCQRVLAFGMLSGKKISRLYTQRDVHQYLRLRSRMKPMAIASWWKWKNITTARVGVVFATVLMSNIEKSGGRRGEYWLGLAFSGEPNSVT